MALQLASRGRLAGPKGTPGGYVVAGRTGDGIYVRILGERVIENVIKPCSRPQLSRSCQLRCCVVSLARQCRKPHQTPRFPSVTVEAPRQVARPQREKGHKGPVRWYTEAGPRDPLKRRLGRRSAAGGPVMAKLARLEREASSCNDGCESSFRHGKDPWVGCSESADTTFIFSANLQGHAHSTGTNVQCTETKMFLGLATGRTILVVLHPGMPAGGKYSGHLTESKQVAAWRIEAR